MVISEETYKIKLIKKNFKAGGNGIKIFKMQKFLKALQRNIKNKVRNMLHNS